MPEYNEAEFKSMLRSMGVYLDNSTENIEDTLETLSKIIDFNVDGTNDAETVSSVEEQHDKESDEFLQERISDLQEQIKASYDETIQDISTAINAWWNDLDGSTRLEVIACSSRLCQGKLIDFELPMKYRTQIIKRTKLQSNRGKLKIFDDFANEIKAMYTSGSIDPYHRTELDNLVLNQIDKINSAMNLQVKALATNQLN